VVAPFAHFEMPSLNCREHVDINMLKLHSIMNDRHFFYMKTQLHKQSSSINITILDFPEIGLVGKNPLGKKAMIIPNFTIPDFIQWNKSAKIIKM